MAAMERMMPRKIMAVSPKERSDGRAFHHHHGASRS
jgi:hypothetical protein